MKASSLFEELAKSIQPLVNDIESKPPTTQDYYGDYYSLLCDIEAKKSPRDAKMTVIALAFTTANKKGVLEAAKLMGYA